MLGNAIAPVFPEAPAVDALPLHSGSRNLIYNN